MLLISDYLFDGPAVLLYAGAVFLVLAALWFARPLLRGDESSGPAEGTRCHNGARMKRLLILGSTGSIGTQALDVVARAGELRARRPVRRARLTRR